ncbi:cell division protein ZapD [Candidatus Rariloculus sp.]|uniref:cell division protein ZapD n=1 Tax=Candidatus Rariloculus sp. TaxID=3101265 RepID=UPI003D0D4D77
MANTPGNLPSPRMQNAFVKFEQPLTERIRTFLRLEILYRQALFHTKNETDLGSRAAVAALLGILSILGHGDVRAEVLKDLDRLANLLTQYRQSPGVDSVRLNLIIERIESLKNELAAFGYQLIGPLRESEFLGAIKHRSWIPGGTCEFDLPEYGYWLQLPYSERAKQLSQWVSLLRPLCDAVGEVLRLIRETSDPVERVVVDGLYRHKLDRSAHYNLVRVMLPAGSGIYPEFSAGKHQFTIRFVEWHGVNQRPKQVSGQLPFLLTLC